MLFRILATVAAVALLVGYFGPVIAKLRELPLGIVLAGGLVVALIDAWESLHDD